MSGAPPSNRPELAGDELRILAEAIEAGQLSGDGQVGLLEVCTSYEGQLGPWAKSQGVQLPFVPAHCDQRYLMFYLLMPSLRARQELIAHLKKHRILEVFHFQPLHASDMGARMGARPGECPVAEDATNRLVRLPFYAGLTAGEQAIVIETIHEYQVG